MKLSLVRPTVIAVCAVFLAAAALVVRPPFVVAETASLVDPVAEAIAGIFAADAAPLPAVDADTRAALRQIYAGRGNRPIWVTAQGPSPLGKDLVSRLTALKSIHPSSADAPIPETGGMTGAAAVKTLAEFDLRLSAAFAAAAVRPSDPMLAARPAAALEVAQSATPARTLHMMLPVDPGFWRLRAGVTAYAGIAAAGGWGAVPDGPKLELGADGPRVAALRQRLAVSGDAIEAGTGPIDQPLVDAIEHFQARHGLAVDGVVGPATLAALNQPVAARLQSLHYNLRRLQQQDRNWGDRYVAVNIAAAAYRLVVSGQVVLQRPAVVGKPSWPTPTLDSVIDQVELHPYWRIPMRIADLEVWPKQEADPGYFAARGIRVIGDRLRQDPGPANPLGVVKFLFDNPYSVYLHDTTSPGLFAQARRFFSHGCVRVSDADQLAKDLLSTDPAWSPDKVAEALAHGGNRRIALLEPIPVHIVYDTAWVDPDGTVEFRADVYHRDRLSPKDALPAGIPVSDAGTGAATGACDG